MGITPHGVLISNAYTDVKEHKEHSQKNTHSKYSNCFSAPENVLPREVGRDDARMSLQEAMEHFLNKMAEEELVKKRTLNKAKHF